MRFFSRLSGQVLVTGQCAAGGPQLPWGRHAHCPLTAWGLGGTQHSIPTRPFLLVCVVWILGKFLGGVMRWPTLFFGGPVTGVSSPLIRVPITPGELPTLHTDQVFGATRVTCGELRYTWPMDNRSGERPSHPATSGCFKAGHVFVR